MKKRDVIEVLQNRNTAKYNEIQLNTRKYNKITINTLK